MLLNEALNKENIYLDFRTINEHPDWSFFKVFLPMILKKNKSKLFILKTDVSSYPSHHHLYEFLIQLDEVHLIDNDSRNLSSYVLEMIQNKESMAIISGSKQLIKTFSDHASNYYEENGLFCGILMSKNYDILEPKINAKDSRPVPSENHQYSAPVILLTFLIDNSHQANPFFLESIEEEINTIINDIDQLTDNIRISIYGNDRNESVCFKSFNDTTLTSFKNRLGYNQLSKTIDLAMSDITNYYRQIKDAGNQLHKPWIIFLESSKIEDSIEPIRMKLKKIISSSSMLFLPIMLNEFEINEFSKDFFNLKRPWVLKNNQIKDMFALFKETIIKRYKTPVEVGVSFDTSKVKSLFYQYKKD
jgi:uncharacterized protein YegL